MVKGISMANSQQQPHLSIDCLGRRKCGPEILIIFVTAERKAILVTMGRSTKRFAFSPLSATVAQFDKEALPYSGNILLLSANCDSSSQP